MASTTTATDWNRNLETVSLFLSLGKEDISWFFEQIDVTQTFSHTPQAKALLSQIAKADSTWRRDGLKVVYEKARQHYESTRSHKPGQLAEVSTPGHEENTMSFDKLIADHTAALIANTAALEANTAAVKAGGGASTKTSAKDKPPTKEKEAETSKPKHSREDLAAIMGKIKAKKSSEVAKELIADVGGSDKLALVAEDKIDALYAAAEAKLAEADDDL